MAYAASVAAGGTPIGTSQSGYPPDSPADIAAIQDLMRQYSAKVGGTGWMRFTGEGVSATDTGQAYQAWYQLHNAFTQFVYDQNPALFQKLTAPDATTASPYLFQHAIAPFWPDFEIINGDFGTGYWPQKYVDDVMSHAHDAGLRHIAIALAAAVGGAAAAGAFYGGGAAADVAQTATTAAEAGGEIAPITLPASAVYLPTSIAPTVLSPTATLLTMPTFDIGAAATLADSLVSSVNTPEMQAAIAAGDVPPPPSSITSSAFTKWATSTGVKYLEQQLGRALTPQEQQSVEQQMAAEIQRLQAQLAGQYSPNSNLPDWMQQLMTDSASRDQLIKYAVIGGLILAGAWALAA
jgi:hypothetical protein